MKFRISSFCLKCKVGSDVIMKSTSTGSVARLTSDDLKLLELWLANQDSVTKPNFFPDLLENGIVVESLHDEFVDWKRDFISAREKESELFVIYFLPTTNCQLNCSYCLESGIDRHLRMTPSTFKKFMRWIEGYVERKGDISELKLVAFGGEPLLEKEMVLMALKATQGLASSHGVRFSFEIVTNGEMLDNKTAALFSRYNWKRVQVTVDGFRDMHDLRRCGGDKRPTFDTILGNILMLSKKRYINKVDLRISLDESNFSSVVQLINFLSLMKLQNFLSISIGLIAPSFGNNVPVSNQRKLAKLAVGVFSLMKEKGFEIPDEFIVGPWCTAIAKNSAVILPDGSIQKCYCMVSRPEFRFSSVDDKAYSCRDPRFESFERMDECVAERCPYLPMCGGGCIYDAVVAYGAASGFKRRFCQKGLLSVINHGLLKLNYA